MTKTLRFLTPLLPLLICPLRAQPQMWEFDSAQTKVEFTLGDVLHTVKGSFQLKRGTVRIDPATGAITGEIVVDATSGASGNSARDRRMHKSILESDQYPEIVLRPDRLEGAFPRQGKATLQMHGIFRIHGADHEVAFPVDVEAGNGQYVAALHFDVPYVQWGMKNPSTLFLRVNDKVNITVRTVARPVASTSRLEKVAQ